MAKATTRPRNAAPSPPSAERKAAQARKMLVRVEERIPAMTDGDLKALHENAKRLSVSGADAQKADAQHLLPLIGAEVDARATVHAQELQAKRDAVREAQKSRPKRVRT